MVLLLRHRQGLRKASGLAAATHPDCYPGLNQALIRICLHRSGYGDICLSLARSHRITAMGSLRNEV